MVKLFESYTIRDITLKNRIVMAPMCTYEANAHGEVQPFHLTHYGSRAVGGIGLIITEATAVLPEGRISTNDLGIWNHHHIEGQSAIVAQAHAYGAKIAIQLAHAGRKSTVGGRIVAPSALAFDENYHTPEEMTTADIEAVIQAFADAATRAQQAGFDVLEIHAAHGYLVNTFLSPLTNKRTDSYGGSTENRYRLLRNIIDAIRVNWDGPLFVRVSAHDYTEGGLVPEDFIQFARWMSSQGVDVVDVSSGAVVPAIINAYPLYQVPFAKTIKEGANVAVGAVGLITTGHEAEQVLQDGGADLIIIGRELLRDPYFPYRAAKQLDVPFEPTVAVYKRGW
ncbi:NADPH dehydrogenase NamA [Metasolibacillus meyeri]|uniref:NADPH dehydrogenase NamA n=1 Tax=Metasolibacillus meyeri TaxID=1071052 RepID=A0AAW9NTC2_9BACL|nr:NADPH dehydrogenase NamA [Metasolibacillus meyeri]MEC1178186.1 NADPH dehydrogenase NamA [Metasolibacillus meyeri]